MDFKTKVKTLNEIPALNYYSLAEDIIKNTGINQGICLDIGGGTRSLELQFQE